MTATQHRTVDVGGLPVFHPDPGSGLDPVAGPVRGFLGRAQREPR